VFQVATTLNDEIRRLSIIVDEFERPFHTDETSLNIYKKVKFHCMHIWTQYNQQLNIFHDPLTVSV